MGLSLMLVQNINSAHHFRWLISQGSQYHKHSCRGGGQPQTGDSKLIWHLFRLFSAQHTYHKMQLRKSMSSFISQPCGDYLPAGLLVQIRWGHFQATPALGDIRQAEDASVKAYHCSKHMKCQSIVVSIGCDKK